MQWNIAKAAVDTFLIHTDLPLINDESKIILDIYYKSDSSFKGSLSIQFYKFTSIYDSILVLSKETKGFKFKNGLNKAKIDFSIADSNTICAQNFYQVLKRTNNVAPGEYKIFIAVGNGSKKFHNVYIQDVDSLLGANSSLRKDINNSLVPKSKSFLGIRLQKAANRAGNAAAGTVLLNARNKVDKTVKKRGLRSEHYQKGDKSYIDLYYKDWFAGRYEVKNKKTLSAQIKEKEEAGIGADAQTDLGHPSVFSQYKALGKTKKDNEEIKGNISLTTNAGNGQEPNSGVDNNYYELKGMVETPILGIPMEVEGYYTSQDSHRQIKSSYFKVHYNADKAKDDLTKSITAYNSKFAAAKSKEGGMNQVYSAAISKLEAQKEKLQKDLADQTKADKLSSSLKDEAKDTSGLRRSIEPKADSNDVKDTDVSTKAINKEKKVSAKVAEKKAKAEETQKKIEVLDKKIEKYKILLAQYHNTNYFDSSLGYDKTKNITGQSSTSYRQMAKSGTNLLPDGKAKGFLSGITTMDAGMFSKYESKYTMSGQMMKGASIGYDFGFCETNGTVGKTEFAGRDGSLDKYTCYSIKNTFKPAKEQKISLTYYGYSADRKLYAGDAFFDKVNISAPGFLEPVHIISTSYSGSFSKLITLEAEVATSLRSSDRTNEPRALMADKMAFHLSAEGNIPNTAVSLGAGYDKTGTDFVNNTLPLSMAGTEQYKVTGRSDFFRSMLTTGLEFDQLIQRNFSGSGNNKKWGFDVKTNFKRYPNVGISYRPFTTFHSYTDTFAIPQRPLIGAVTTVKITYQIKRKTKSLRFSVLYSKSETTMDTIQSGTTLLQSSVIYSDKTTSHSLSIGSTLITGTEAVAQPGVAPPTPGDTKFLTITSSIALSKQLSVSGGQDLGWAVFGLCKYSFNGGVTFALKKKPISLRMNLRGSTYELNKLDGWKQIYSGSFDINYRFKVKKRSTEK